MVSELLEIEGCIWYLGFELSRKSGVYRTLNMVCSSVCRFMLRETYGTAADEEGPLYFYNFLCSCINGKITNIILLQFLISRADAAVVSSCTLLLLDKFHSNCNTKLYNFWSGVFFAAEL